MPKKDSSFVAPKTRQALDYFYYSESERTYLPRYPVIYSAKELGKYTWDFDVFYELYIEQNPVVTPIQGFIYRHLWSLSNRKIAISLKEYARRVLHCRHNKLIDHLDRLQDALLLYRICRVDTQGRPNDIVLQTPLSRKAWREQSWRMHKFEPGKKMGEQYMTRGEEILDRVRTQCTKLERREMGKAWPGDEFKFSQRRIESAFGGDANRAEEFTVMVLDILFQLRTNQWKGRKAKELFEKELMRQAERKSIIIDQAKFLAALEIQKRYSHNLFKVE
jgi:hypothetical protein